MNDDIGQASGKQNERRHDVKRKWAILGALVAGLLLMSAAQAAPNAPNIDWWVIGGGGGSDTASGTTLSGTIGQVIAGTDSDGTQELCAGFWCGAAAEYKIYLPLILKDFQ
jgi:hypothetical protein